MSVTTSFDRHRDRCRELLDDLISELSDLLTDKSEWGYKDMSEEYLLDLTESLTMLIAARRKM